MIEFEEGRIVGPYRILRCIGQGGMGTVYEVEHVELGVHYALKTFTLPEDAAHAEVLRQKFFEEGKVLARLKGPHLVHVFDLAIDEQTGVPYFVMDLVTYEDGLSYSLADLMDAEFDEELAFDWFKDACETLDYVHAQGIVHRDIKPSNLMLDAEQHVILADFGVSKIFGSGLHTDIMRGQTQSGDSEREKLVMGTEGYMAPEVESGEEATPAADRYSLGMTFLVLLNKGAKFDSVSAALAHLSKMPYKFRWSAVLPKLLTPTPARRPGELTPLLRFLDPCVLEREAKAKLEAAKNRRNRKLAVVGVVATVLVTLAGLGVAWFIHERGSRQLAERERIAAAEKAAFEQQIAALNDLQKEELRRAREGGMTAAEVEAKVRAALAEKERRSAEEKAATEKAAAEKRAKEAARARIERETAEKRAREAVQKKATEEPKTLVFAQEDKNEAEEVLGEIPNRQYNWLNDGDRDAPNRVTFLLANKAKIDFVPLPRGSFFMSNTPDALKNNHKVTLTRPFWFSRTPLTVDQWREFGPNDYGECREIEKALDAAHPLVLSLTRKSVDDYCAYLTRKYRRQLPKDYVFRLPSEAEWEYAADSDATIRKYNKPNVRGWGEFVGVAGETARNNFRELGTTRKLASLCGWESQGWVKGKTYGVGCLALPNARGICDLYGWDRHVLDLVKRDRKIEYADEETDPLRFPDGIYDQGRTLVLTRDWVANRPINGYDHRSLAHIVVGPDLVGEQAWKNPKTVYETKAKVPQQVKRFDPKKIKNKLSKPQEIRLKRVGGFETVFCEIPKGRFNMSNVEGQSKLNHRVDLTYPFWMSKFLVTTKEWREYAPNDFQDSLTLAAEQNFSRKYPVCIRTRQSKWRAYCAFLKERYKLVLPAGYVFRLPTEAEWEWAFIADDNNNVRNMRGDMFNNCHGSFRQKFDAEYKQRHWPANVDYDSCGRIGDVYVGGRTVPTGFGVMDILAGGWFDNMTLDNYDVMWRDGDYHHSWGDAVASMNYGDKEVNPLHSDGCRASFVVVRGGGAGRHLLNQGHPASAHIVIAPDLETPLLANEKLPYPAEDFGGKWLGDLAKRAAQSSMHEQGRNTEARIKRMLSLESRAAMVGKVDDPRGFHTKQEDKPWIMLELDKRRQITGLVIESWGWSTKPLRIWVSDDGKTVKPTPIAKDDVGHKRYRFDFQHRNITTKYLVIGREPGVVKDWFYLDKVVIYGK